MVDVVVSGAEFTWEEPTN